MEGPLKNDFCGRKDISDPSKSSPASFCHCTRLCWLFWTDYIYSTKVPNNVAADAAATNLPYIKCTGEGISNHVFRSLNVLDVVSAVVGTKCSIHYIFDFSLKVWYLKFRGPEENEAHNGRAKCWATREMLKWVHSDENIGWGDQEELRWWSMKKPTPGVGFMTFQDNLEHLSGQRTHRSPSFPSMEVSVSLAAPRLTETTAGWYIH